MGKNKLILEKIIDPISDSDGEEHSDADGNDSDDSDAELAKEFAEGKLKPGLYGLVPLKRTTEQINDKEGLKKKLDEIKLFEDNWLERLDVVSQPSPISAELAKQYGDLDLKINSKGKISAEESNEDPVQNDFKRELLFYRQAQSTVIEAMNRFHNQYGIKDTRRPDDYLAEMAKSDEHMKKVHAKLQAKQTSLEASEKAKRLREQKKYGKKVQQEVQLKRQMEKKELLDKIQRYKKGKLDSLDFLDSGPENSKKANSVKNGNQSKKLNNKITKKQRYKEAKYGYGGRKKGSKHNSSASAADVSGFSARKHGRPVKKTNRPGKSRRQKMKNKSK